MNPVDHPHGGGEGRTKGGRPSVSPWGLCAYSMEVMPCAVASILASDAGASSCSLLNWHFTLRAERELSKGLFVK